MSTSQLHHVKTITQNIKGSPTVRLVHLLRLIWQVIYTPVLLRLIWQVIYTPVQPHRVPSAAWYESNTKLTKSTSCIDSFTLLTHKYIWQLDLRLSMQSVPITTKVVSLYTAHGEVYSEQLYVIRFVSDLRHVDGFLCVSSFFHH